MALLERDPELAALSAACRRARDGHGSVLAVVGPAGIGKTGLVTAAVEGARDLGLATVLARGGRMEADLAFGAVRQVFAPLLRAHPDLLGLAEPAAAQVLGRGREPGAPVDQGTLLQALLWTLGDAVERSPLLIVADDLHWWDLPSLRFIAFLARRLTDLPLALVLASRPPAPGADELAAVLADPDVRRLEPAPLSPGAVGVLAAERFGAEVGTDFVAACVASAGGNPFLTRELLAGLSDTDPAAVNASPGSSTRILERLGRLAPHAEALAQAVAVLGSRADPHLSSRLADLDADKVAHAADLLQGAGLLTADRPFAFAHPLVRQAVYDGIPPGERSRRHRRAAELLADVGARSDDLGSHLLLTDPAGDPWVVDRLVEAAADAAVEAPELAFGLLARARAEPAAPRHRGLVLTTGLAAARIGHPTAVPLLREAFAQATDGGERLVVAGHLRAALADDGAAFDDAVAASRTVLAEAVDPDVRLRCLAGIAQAALVSDGAGTSSDVVRAFLAEVPLDDLGLPPEVLAVRAFGAFTVGEPMDLVVPAARRAVEVHHATRDEGVAPWFWHAAYALWFADAPDAEEVIRVGVERSRHSPVIERVIGATCLGWIAVTRGRLVEAETVARSALEILTLGRQAFYRRSPVGVLLEVHLARGEVAEAEALLEGQDLDGDLPPSAHATLFLLRRARLRAATGRIDDGIADLELVGRRTAVVDGFGPGPFPWRSELALLLHRAGRDQQRARALAEDELAQALQVGGGRPIARARAAVGTVTQDAALLVQAVEGLRVAGDVLLEAGALVQVGALQRRSGSPEARDTLRAALDLGDRIGAGAITARAREELALAGARVHRARTWGAEALTPAELRTARLAAAGATNRDIAQAHFVTVKNVEAQLASTYRKLGCGGRSGLAEALRSTGEAPGAAH